MEKTNNSTVDSDLGLTRRTSVAVRSDMARTDVIRACSDVQEEANRLMTTTAPETIVQKFLDALAPSDVRRERRRGEKEVVRQEVDARIAIHQAFKDVQVREIRIRADAHITERELIAVKETGMAALNTETQIETELKRSGAEFDEGIDEAVKKARALESQSARESAADRIERLKLMRGKVETVIMENVANAIRGPRSRE